MYGREKKRKKTKYALTFLMLVVFLLSLDNIFPVKIINPKLSEDVPFPENPFVSYSVVYGIKTYRNNPHSLITDKDLLEALKKTDIKFGFLTGSDEKIFEGKYGEFYIFDKKLQECKGIFDINDLNINLFNFFSYIKFYLWYPINREIAYNNLWKLFSDNYFFENFDQEKDKCFIGENSGRIILKSSLLNFPDLSGQLKLIKNRVYLEERLINEFYSTKLNLYLSMDSGRLVTNIFFDPQLEIFIKTDDGFFTVGDLLSLSINPHIYIKLKKGKYITAVFKNGKLLNYYLSDKIYIKPNNPGYYNIIVYKYNFRLPLNIFIGIRPVAFSNGIFIQ
ncbi:hypothetical protein [Persephonella sp.]